LVIYGNKKNLVAYVLDHDVMSRALAQMVMFCRGPMLLDIWEFFIVQSRAFKYSIDEAKRCFYRAANAIFGKIGRLASEEVTLHLLKTKCILVLLYGLEVLRLNKSQISSIDFVINRFFMKLFNIIILKLSSAVSRSSVSVYQVSLWLAAPNFFRQN